jgi:hypothetical protein
VNIHQIRAAHESLNHATLFAHLAGLRGPFLTVGDCLAPQFPHGTFMWVDPRRAPQAGDLVWYDWSDVQYKFMRDELGGDYRGGVKWMREVNGQPLPRLQ